MSEQDIEFVDWMPKEFDVFLKGLAKKENFDKLSSNIIEFIEELYDNFAIERLENSHCSKCNEVGARVECTDLFNGNSKILCENCFNEL